MHNVCRHNAEKVEPFYKCAQTFIRSKAEKSIDTGCDEPTPMLKMLRIRAVRQDGEQKKSTTTTTLATVSKNECSQLHNEHTGRRQQTRQHKSDSLGDSTVQCQDHDDCMPGRLANSLTG